MVKAWLRRIVDAVVHVFNLARTDFVSLSPGLRSFRPFRSMHSRKRKRPAPKFSRARVDKFGKRSLPYVPRGKKPFNPTLDPALSGLQRRAVNALFERLGQEWIPPEYFAFLSKYPQPTEALTQFCLHYSIEPGRIAHEDHKATAEFDLLISHLIQIDLLRNDLNHEQLDNLAELRTRHPAESFDAILDLIEQFNALRKKAIAYCSRYPFSVFKVFFEDVFFDTDLDSIDRDRISRCKEIIEWYKSLVDRIEDLDRRLHESAKPDEFGQQLWDDLKQALQTAVTPDEFIHQFKQHTDNIEVFMRSAHRYRRKTKDEREPRAHGSKDTDKCRAHFRSLEMIDATLLTFAAAKASWRRLVKKYHPDNPAGDETKFREVQSAWEYLKDNAQCFELCRTAA